MHVGLDVQLMRVRGWTGPQAALSQQDSEIAHYREYIFSSPPSHYRKSMRELEEDLGRTEQNEPPDTFNKLSLQR